MAPKKRASKRTRLLNKIKNEKNEKDRKLSLIKYWFDELDRILETVAEDCEHLSRLTKRRDLLVIKITAIGSKPNTPKIDCFSLNERIKDLIHYRRGKQQLLADNKDKEFNWVKFNDTSSSLQIREKGEFI